VEAWVLIGLFLLVVVDGVAVVAGRRHGAVFFPAPITALPSVR